MFPHWGAYGRSTIQVCQRRVGGALLSVSTLGHLWGEHLTSLPKKGAVGGALLSVSTVNHKRAPMYAYSDLMPSKQIIGQTRTYNTATSGFKVES